MPLNIALNKPEQYSIIAELWIEMASRKELVNSVCLVFKPDGTVYDNSKGQRPIRISDADLDRIRYAVPGWGAYISLLTETYREDMYFWTTDKQHQPAVDEVINRYVRRFKR